MNFLNKFKIPTLLGLFLILSGLGAGIYLVLQDTTNFFVSATPDIVPQKIVVTNIKDGSVSISWQTDSPTFGFVTFGQTESGENTALDDRDKSLPLMHTVHHVSLKNLLPATAYKFKIVSGKFKHGDQQFTTAPPTLGENGFKPIVGTVDYLGKGVEESLVYLTVAGAAEQSAAVRDFGNFIIPLSRMRKTDLGQIFAPTKDTLAKLRVVSPLGEASMVFKLTDDGNPLPNLEIGQNLDITKSQQEKDFTKFDLVVDGVINTSDYSIVLQNLGRDPKDKRADLNGDGVVDQKDLDLMSQKISQQR